jgi:hypothetical protein
MAKWSRGPENFGKLLHQIGAPLPTATARIVTLLECSAAWRSSWEPAPGCIDIGPESSAEGLPLSWA